MDQTGPSENTEGEKKEIPHYMVFFMVYIPSAHLKTSLDNALNQWSNA